MTTLDFARSREITKKVLDDNLILIDENTYVDGSDMGVCDVCKTNGIEKLKTESSWTSAIFCHTGNTISFVIRADRQGGNCNETVYTYA